MSDCAIVIASLSDAGDGLNATAAIAGGVTGNLRLLLSRTPVLAQASAVAFALAGAGQYHLLLPHPGLWYVWAQDDTGTTNAQAVWTGLEPGVSDLDLCGETLRALLEANAAGLNVALQTILPGVTTKQFVYGSATDIRDFPAILICKPRQSEEWVAFPMVKSITYTFDIMFYILHQDKGSMLRAAARLLGAAMSILNQPASESLSLPSGTPLAFCAAQSGDADDVEVETDKWVAIGSLVWSGNTLKQDAIIP